MTTSLASWILKRAEENECSDLELGVLSISEVRQIVSELEKEDPYHIFVILLFSDNSATVERANYWAKGENANGIQDQLIFSFNLKEEEE